MTARIACLLLTSAVATPALAAAPTGEVPPELARARDMYRALASYNVVAERSELGKPAMRAAMHDVERLAEDMDDRLATGDLLVQDRHSLTEIRELTAKAHLQAALILARGADLGESIVHYERAVELLGFDPAQWDAEIEREGHRGQMPLATEAAYHVVPMREAVDDLKAAWSAGVVTRIELRELGPALRKTLRIERGATASSSPSSEVTYGYALKRFAEGLKEPGDELRIVLPPGRYSITSESETEKFEPVEFVLVGNSAPDPIVVNPNWFSFAFPEDSYERCRPALTYNGLPVGDLSHVRYGTYRLVPSERRGCFERVPDKIVVEQGSEVTLRSDPQKLDELQPGQPIFLYVTTPPKSVYWLRM
ncbi:MAG: hypothetical protein KBD01_08840 [Acidobacteria bacterium]|nr:hypothetical protein [Acidobacteriota bacterium]